MDRARAGMRGWRPHERRLLVQYQSNTILRGQPSVPPSPPPASQPFHCFSLFPNNTLLHPSFSLPHTLHSVHWPTLPGSSPLILNPGLLVSLISTSNTTLKLHDPHSSPPKLCPITSLSDHFAFNDNHYSPLPFTVLYTTVFIHSHTLYQAAPFTHHSLTRKSYPSSHSSFYSVNPCKHSYTRQHTTSTNISHISCLNKALSITLIFPLYVHSIRQHSFIFLPHSSLIQSFTLATETPLTNILTPTNTNIHLCFPLDIH